MVRTIPLRKHDLHQRAPFGAHVLTFIHGHVTMACTQNTGKRFKELSEDIKSATYTVPLRTPQHEVDAEATIIGSRIVAASVKLQLSKKGGGGGGGPGENVFKLSCSNPWLVDQLTACKRHMVTTLMTLPHPVRPACSVVTRVRTARVRTVCRRRLDFVM